jgi:hypothetical protein
MQIVPLPLAENASQSLPFQGIIDDAFWQQGDTGSVLALRSLPFQSYASVLPNKCASGSPVFFSYCMINWETKYLSITHLVKPNTALMRLACACTSSR